MKNIRHSSGVTDVRRGVYRATNILKGGTITTFLVTKTAGACLINVNLNPEGWRIFITPSI